MPSTIESSRTRLHSLTNHLNFALMATIAVSMPLVCTSPVAAADSHHTSTGQSAYSAEEQATMLNTNELPNTLSALESTFDDAGTKHHPWRDETAWINDIGTLLYRDSDDDGFFIGFSLSIDADTAYDYMEVYVTIDMQMTDTERESLHSSSDFSLYRNSLSDEYRIDIDLLQNYPTDHYDLHVSLYDAHDNRLLDTVSAGQFDNLARLPLESEDLDYSAPVIDEPRPVNDDIVVTEYAGSAGLLFSGLMLLSLVLRRRDRLRARP